MQKPPKKPALALDTQLVSDNLPLQVLPKLFIGSVHSSFNVDAMTELGITHILNCSRLPSNFPKQFVYLNVDIRDREDSNILSCIPIANTFIEAGMENGGILVHCIGGRSRSAAFIAGYLMSSLRYSYDDALALIVCARPVASINRGFEIQLRAYSQNNFDVYLAQQILVRSRIRALQNIRGSKSSIDIISANIEMNNLKLLNQGRLQNQRKHSDGELRVLAPNSISKPISRSSFSPCPDNSLQHSDLLSSVSGSGQKRTWVDSGNGIDDTYTSSKHHDAPEQDNDIRTFPAYRKNSLKDLSVDIKGDPILEPHALSSTSGSLSISAFATKSNSRSSSFVIQGRESTDELILSVTDLGSHSRRNSATLIKDPSLRAVFDSPSQQSLTLPKILSKSPSITDSPVSIRNKGSRKNSLDSSLAVPMPALHAVGRSKSLVPPLSDGLGQSPVVQKSKTPSLSNNHNPDNTNQSILSPVLSSRRSSNYALDTNDIQGSPRPDCGSAGNTLPKHDSFHIAGKASASDLLTLPGVSHGTILQTPTKPSISSGRSKPVININSCQDVDNGYDYNGMKDGETPTPNYSEQKSRRGSKGKGESGGYQSIIREYIPLFDSRTPNIRYSRPGVVAVRVIPPLRGLDKGFCCAWCSASLFTLANVVRVDFDVLAATRSGGFNILPTKEENRRLVHIPTSTTSKTTGLFMRKRSVDMAAAMISGHNSIIQQLTALQPPSTGSRPMSRSGQDHSSSVRSDIINQTDLDKGDFSMEDNEEGDTLTALENKAFDKSKMSFKPIVVYVPPPSTKSRHSKSFNFNDSSEQSNLAEENFSMDDKPVISPSFLPQLSDKAESLENPKMRSSSSHTNPLENTFTPTSTRSSTSTGSISPFVTNQYPEESPRIIIPAKVNVSSNDKLLSVEKKRWLDRVNLLRSDNNGKLSAMADADDEAQSTALLHEKYVFLEYLEWMGVDCFNKDINFGDISCYSCKRVIGSWTWTPTESQSVGGKLENPVIRIHRHVVYQSDFLLDSTPLSTPKAERDVKN